MTKEEFTLIFSALVQSCPFTTDNWLAKMYGVQRPTITRWRTGVTAPHESVRVMTCARLAKLIRDC